MTFIKVSINQFDGKECRIFYHDEVLSIIQRLSIPIIDIRVEVFASHPDPLSLFSFRYKGHYIQ